MDKEALVLRNRAMTEAFHALPLRHRIRRGLLHTVAQLPIRRQRTQRTERILLIRPDHLGDVLLTTPALHALRRARPEAELHALVGPWAADVLANTEAADVILTLPFPGFQRNNGQTGMSPYRLAWRTAQQLRRVGYSSAVIMRPDHWWGALVAFLAGIPVRVGYDQTDVAPFLTHVVPLVHQHAVIQNARLVERWTGRLPVDSLRHGFIVNPEDAGYIDSYLAEWGGQPTERLICIHPGSGTWVKRWEDHHWALVADTLADQLDASVVITGGDHELGLARRITSQMQHDACVMVGETKVGQLAALFKRALVVIGPDSGPLHLAAAVQSPTVALFGPADPVEFAPWGKRDRHMILTTDIGCRPCRVLDWGSDNPAFHPCVRDISVGQVLEAARMVVNINETNAF